MKNIINVYKPVGKTPFEMVKKVKETYPQFAEEKIGYAGRLDPMAHGVLLLLIGETNKQKVKFEKLPKKYSFKVIFGIETDSFDLLGKIKGGYKSYNSQDLKRKLKKIIKEYPGGFLQTYPPYSAIRLNGKPLYYWERRGKLAPEKIPQKKVTIRFLTLQQTGSISSENLYSMIKKLIPQVTGNFRQTEILKYWDNFFQNNNAIQFTTAEFSLECTSGTYVRSIINDLGGKLGCGATALSILRTAVGKYHHKKSIIMEF